MPNRKEAEKMGMGTSSKNCRRACWTSFRSELFARLGAWCVVASVSLAGSRVAGQEPSFTQRRGTYGEGQSGYAAQPTQVSPGVERRESQAAATRSQESPAVPPLTPPSTEARGSWAQTSGARGSFTSAMLGLALVVGLFVAVMWALRRIQPKAAALLPPEVVEVLGRAPLAGRQQAHVLRFGNKLLLVSVSPGGADFLGELDDPREVDRISGLCQERNPRSATQAFQNMLQHLSTPPKTISARVPASGRVGGQAAARGGTRLSREVRRA